MSLESENNPPPHPGPFRHATRDEPLIPHTEGSDWSKYRVPAIFLILLLIGGSVLLLIRDQQRRNPVIEAEVQRANSVPTRLEEATGMPAWVLPYKGAINSSVTVQPVGNNVAHVYQFLTSDPVPEVLAFYKQIFGARGLKSINDTPPLPLPGDATNLPTIAAPPADPNRFSAADEKRLRSVDIIGSATSVSGQSLIIVNYLVEKGALER